jgi:hypothetical protein
VLCSQPPTRKGIPQERLHGGHVETHPLERIYVLYSCPFWKNSHRDYSKVTCIGTQSFLPKIMCGPLTVEMGGEW